MDKEVVVHIHNAILLSYKKKSVPMWRMKLESIIQSEVSQKEKHQYSILTQRKAMPKNAQTTAQLHSSHTLVN